MSRHAMKQMYLSCALIASKNSKASNALFSQKPTELQCQPMEIINERP